MVMKHTTPITVRGSMPDKINAKSFSAADRFVKSDIVETITYFSKLINIRYNGKENIREYIINIREYIIKMSNLVYKLKALKLKLSEEILVHFILISISYKI